MGDTPESNSPYKQPEAFLPSIKREELLAAREEQENFEAEQPDEPTGPYATEFSSPLETPGSDLLTDLTDTVTMYINPELTGENAERAKELLTMAEKVKQLEKYLAEVQQEFDKLAGILQAEANKRFPNLAGTLADEAEFAKHQAGTMVERWQSQLKVYAEGMTNLAGQLDSEMFKTALKELQSNVAVVEQLGKLEDAAHDLADKYLDATRGRGEGYSADASGELRTAMNSAIAKFHEHMQDVRAELKLELDKLSQR